MELEFKKRVPIFDYNRMYREWWHKTHAGDEDVSWPGKTKYFALSSGTSGASSKYIPITNTMLKSLKRGAFKMFTNFPKYSLPEVVYTSGWLAIGGTTQLEEYDRQYFGYLSGINARERPLWTRGFYKPGTRIAKIADFDHRLDLIAQKAKNWDIGVIIGIPHWIMLSFEKIIEYNRIEKITEIWPNLNLFISGGVDYKPYKKNLEMLIGREVQFMDTYIASEGMIAFRADPEDQGMKLLTNNRIYFEFLPFNERNFDDEGEIVGEPQTLMINEVNKEEEYALVISTCSGAWRYIIGDTVKFANIEKKQIIISGRTKHYINLHSEHLTIDNMNMALSFAEEKINASFPEFTITPIASNGYYAHHWFVGTEDDIDPENLKSLIDQQLCILNDDYKTERNKALTIELEVLPLHYFYDWQRENDQLNAQSKIPRVMKGEMLKNWLAFLEKRRTREALFKS